MIKQNYMDIYSKIKAPAKFKTFGDTQTPGLRESLLGGLSAPATPSVPGPDEAIKLHGKDDVFNYELSPHQIETELLCGERLYFSIKFSTEKRDLSLKVIKNIT
jgi:hypothetical protein